MMDDRPHEPQADSIRQPQREAPPLASPVSHSSPQPTPAAVELQIGELVLHGFERVARDRVGAAVESELARLLAERGIPENLTTMREIEQLRAGQFELTARATAESIGAQIARSIYRGLGRD